MGPLFQGVVTASLTVLDENQVAVDVILSRITDAELQVDCTLTLALGAPVKVVQDRHLWLGIVISCQPGRGAAIRIEHALRDIDGLSLLADRFLGKRQSETAKSTTLS
jgi:hypothetical protein